MAVLVVLAVFIVAVLLLRRWVNRPYAPNWHRQARLYKYATIYWGIAIVTVGIVSFTDQEPFWPEEAISFACGLAMLSCLIYSWREAKRRAAAEPLPAPPPSPPPGEAGSPF